MKENFGENHGQNILRHFVTLPVFFLTQVKRSLIITNEHGICELPHDLQINLRLVVLEN